MKRTVLHCDFNNFFASVACRDNPSLKDKPVVVCGSVEERHGIVLAKNELAKSFGIKTGETVFKAESKCRNLVTVKPDFKRYVYFSKEARKIYTKYTDLVEAFSIDENWLDVTESERLFGNGREIADRIRAEIRNELGLTVSVGVSFNKIFAKLASDLKKPDATTEISEENFKQIVWKLPSSAMIGVGPHTDKKLHSLGLFTVGDIALANPEVLNAKLHKNGVMLWNYANGRDDSPVAHKDYKERPKSIGRSVTCKRDITTPSELHEVFLFLSEDISHSLRKWGLSATGVQISLKSPELVTDNLQCSLRKPTFLTSEIEKAGMDLFRSNGGFKTPVRAAGIRVFGLTDNSAFQIAVFDNIDKMQKLEKIEMSVDSIRNRFGKSSICRASLLGKQQSDSEKNDILPQTAFKSKDLF